MNRLLIYGVMALSAPAAAQTVADQAATNVGEVVVTATRTPVPRLAVADSITLIGARDIAFKQQQTLPDVLADVPGLNVVQSGGAGGQTSVFMRGTDSNHVKVLMDGIDMSDPSSPVGAFDFGQFVTAGVERVEVLRGPQSGLYGSDAIGGVINIITERGEGPARLTADVEGGSFGTNDESASLSGSTGAFHYAVTAAHLDSAATPVTPLDTLAPGEARNDDAYDNLTLATKLGYDLASHVDLGLTARYTDSYLRLTGDDDVYPYAYPDPVQSVGHDLQYYTRGFVHWSLWDGRFDETLGLAYSQMHSTQVTPNYGTSLYEGDRVKADWQGDVAFSKTETLVVGAEDQRDAIGQPLSANTNIASGYAELQSNPFRDFNDTLSARYDANSRFGGAFTYRVAPTYLIEATDTKLEASLGTGFKAPTLSQMYQSFPAYGFFGNPDLKPERSLGLDVGFEQYLLGRRLQFGATYFYNRITDLIDDNATFTTDINIGRAHTDGIESFVLVQPLRTLSVRLDYTYTDAEDDVLHQELLRRPHDKRTVDARWQATSKLSLDADVQSLGSWIDGNRDFSIPRLLAPGYTIANLAANYDVGRQLTLYARVNNLLNTAYEDPYGFLRPGRGVFGGVKLRL